MENFMPVVVSFSTLLADTYKIYLQNGRLMAFLAVLIISLHSLLYLFNVFSVKIWITDLIMNQTYQLSLATPGSPEYANHLIDMQNDFKLLALVEWLVLFIGFVAFLFFVTLITYASALIHGGKVISIKDLLSLTARSLKKPLITYFYFTLLSFGYLALCFFTLLPIWLLLRVAGYHIDLLSVSTILYTIPATVLSCYLSIVWNLSLVVSILEQKFGIEALWKAEQIVKGMKLQGFILNLLLNIIRGTLLQCLRLTKPKQSEVIRTVIGLVVVTSISTVRMFGYTAYTVLYYRCKKSHGEGVELQGADFEYTKIPTAPLINENIP